MDNIEKLLGYAQDRQLAVFQELNSITENTDSISKTLSGIEIIQGEQGEQGIQGEKGDAGDTGEQGIPGERGEKGDKGDRGIDGLNGADGVNGKDGKDGVGKDGKDGIDGKDGSPDTPEQVIEKVNSASTLIKKERVEGLPQAIQNAAANALSALPPTTSFINGTRAKNLNFTGATVSYSGDTATVAISGAPADTITGTLTTNTIPKATGVNTIGNSQITDTGSVVAIAQTATPTYRFELGTGLAATDAIRSWAGIDFYKVPDPTTLPTLALAAGTDLGIGQYFYTVTFYTALGETHGTGITTYQTITTTAGNQNVNLTNIPVSTDPRVVGRKLYRTVVGGSNYTAGLLTTIADNTTTTFLDNVPDGSLGIGSAVHFRANTTSNLITISGTKAMNLDNNLTLFGYGAGASITSGGWSTLIGFNAGNKMTSGTVNVLIGDSAGVNLTTGYQNVFIGASAGGNMTTGFTSVAIGYGSGAGSTGSGNTSVGQISGSGLTSGSRNVNVGAGAGKTSTTASDNTFVGQQSGSVTTAGGNSFFGSYSGTRNTSGTRNVFTGQYVGFYNTTGSDNVFIGSGQNANVTGSFNTYLGSLSGNQSTGSGNVFLGYSAGYNELGSNLLYIANTNTTTPLIYGNFTTGSISIGLGAPTARLHLPAGTATANTAPLKFTSGTSLTTPESGCVEFDGSDYFLTV